ncbi:MAG TPA: hypothetical protein VMM78_08525 [Thermomicrobiales bacterium]|nr:hypothetical protein [Thermomicrobiales bacterium]
MLARMVDWLRGVQSPQGDPVCRMHGVPMELHKKVGRPARFQEQQTASYTLLYRCVVPGCNETDTRTRVRNQIPAPGETTERPIWASRDRKGF